MSLPAHARRLAGRLRSAYARRLGVDPRALVALRVALASLLLADLLLRARSLAFFYTDVGVLPRSLLRARFPLVSRLSIHTLSGEVWWTALLFALAGLAGLALLAGYRTRTAAVCSWLLLVSLHARDPIVLNGGDSLLRRTLLWSLFLPLGTGLSLGAARVRGSTDADAPSVSARGIPSAPGRITHPAAAALLVQPVVLYVVNAVIKLRGDAWPSGRAIRMVFSIDALTVLLGDALAEFPALLEALGLGWLVLLWCSPLLILTTGRARVAVVGAFGAAHLGMALTLGVGLFPLVSVAALVPFLPPGVWDAVERRLAGSGERIRRNTERLRRDAGEVRRYTWGIQRDMWGIGRGVGEIRAIAIDAGRAVAAVLLVVVLVWNAAALGYVPAPEPEAGGVSPTETRWDMFAPSPPREDVWYVAAGTLRSGGRVELVRGGDIEWERDAGLGTTYPSARWRKYLETVRWSDDDALRRAFASGLCARWNRAHGDARSVESLTLYRLEQPTRLGEREPTERVRVLSHTCSDGG